MKIESADGQAGNDIVKVTLRAASPADACFVDELTRSVMAKYVAQTWPNPADQEAYFLKNRFVCDTTQIIQYNGRDIGRFTVMWTEAAAIIDNIHLLPEYHGSGIGKTLIEETLQEAHDKRKYVELQVLIVNPAQSLYRRLGFETVRKDNERLYMRTSTQTDQR